MRLQNPDDELGGMCFPLLPQLVEHRAVYRHHVRSMVYGNMPARVSAELKQKTRRTIRAVRTAIKLELRPEDQVSQHTEAATRDDFVAASQRLQAGSRSNSRRSSADRGLSSHRRHAADRRHHHPHETELTDTTLRHRHNTGMTPSSSQPQDSLTAAAAAEDLAAFGRPIDARMFPVDSDSDSGMESDSYYDDIQKTTGKLSFNASTSPSMSMPHVSPLLPSIGYWRYWFPNHPLSNCAPQDVTEQMAAEMCEWEHVRRFWLESELEIVVLMEGIDAITSDTCQARHSYTIDDIVWDGDFEPCVTRTDDGQCSVDYAALHRTMPRRKMPE